MRGFLLVNKPSGITSYQIIRNIKLFFRGKIGHGGTLDPFATGLLVILINEATKLAPFILDLEKEYEGRIRLGCRTDTYDITGKVLEEKPAGHFNIDFLRKWREVSPAQLNRFRLPLRP